MKLALSNIAWAADHDESMYQFMAANGITGLEIAPTRLFGETPYSRLDAAAAFATNLWARYHLSVCSMQSIWYRRTERLFGEDAERRALLDYTQQAILFAEAIGCPVLVLGSPKNRVLDDEQKRPLAVEFLRSAGAFAALHGCTLALEANPKIYGTNFINTTPQAFELIRSCGCAGLGVNVDVGTLLINGETTDSVRNNADLVVHVHISEPHLAPVEPREQHSILKELLTASHYRGFVSIEMATQDDDAPILKAAQYLREVFS